MLHLRLANEAGFATNRRGSIANGIFAARNP
jgi:hypothetical protein